MRKVFILFVALMMTVFCGVFPVAYAETDQIYELVFDTVKQAYNIEVEDYKVAELEDGTIYCSFKEGYAILEKQNDEFIIQKIWCDTTRYYSSYFGSGTYSTETFTVSYNLKKENKTSLALKYPKYVIGSVTCVPNAAICIVGFYDRYYDDLIPNFKAGKSIGSAYMYSNADDSVISAAKQLAYDMGVTNLETDGVTVSRFKNGLQNYCARKSLVVDYFSCMSFGQFNYNNVVAHLNSNRPVIIFTSKHNLSTITTSNNTDTVTLNISNSNHAMAVFGYWENTYTLSDGNIRTDKYLQVANGNNLIESYLVNVNMNIAIDDAYAVQIH